MRKIEFRGKTLNSKKWIYGGYCKDASGYDCILLPIKGGHVFEPVIPKSVGQFTGLKDKNGKEIYEGNILEKDCNKALVEVLFSNGSFKGKWLQKEIADENERIFYFVVNKFDDGQHTDWFEIIGNITEKKK